MVPSSPTAYRSPAELPQTAAKFFFVPETMAFHAPPGGEDIRGRAAPDGLEGGGGAGLQRGPFLAVKAGRSAIFSHGEDDPRAMYPGGMESRGHGEALIAPAILAAALGAWTAESRRHIRSVEISTLAVGVGLIGGGLPVNGKVHLGAAVQAQISWHDALLRVAARGWGEQADGDDKQ